MISAMPVQKTIIFTHIPKTAGSTFDYIVKSSLKNKFGEKQFIKMKNKKYCENNNIKYPFSVGEKVPLCPKYISGHFPYGIHNIFCINDFQYVTFLRDPVSRYMSHINHLYRFFNSTRPGAGKLKKIYRDNDIFRMIRNFNRYTKTDNLMVKLLSGYFSYQKVIYNTINKSKRFKDIKKIKKFPDLFSDQNNELSEESDEWLVKAKDNLSKYYLVGFQEYFRNDTINIFDKLKLNMDIDKVLSVKRRRSYKYFQKKVKACKCRKKVCLLISKINKWDVLLYDFAINNLR